jgi:hypothetical protein
VNPPSIYFNDMDVVRSGQFLDSYLGTGDYPVDAHWNQRAVNQHIEVEHAQDERAESKDDPRRTQE